MAKSLLTAGRKYKIVYRGDKGYAHYEAVLIYRCSQGDDFIFAIGHGTSDRYFPKEYLFTFEEVPDSTRPYVGRKTARFV